MRTLLSLVAAAGLLLLSGTPAGAIQFDIGVDASTDARLHTISDGQPGAQWNTGGGGAGGEIDYDSGAEEFVLTGVLDTLNYWDPNDGSCSTSTSNCSFGFPAGNLDITLEGAFDSITLTPQGSNVLVQAMFTTTVDGNADMSITDPDDPGFGPLLEADWQAGTFNGQPTPGLTVSVLWDGSSVVGTPSAVGFLAVDPGSEYGSLFESGGDYFQLNVGQLFGFAPALDSIVQTAINTGALPDFTAEGQGQIYRTAGGQFEVPEPSLLALLGAGLGLAALRRRS